MEPDSLLAVGGVSYNVLSWYYNLTGTTFSSFSSTSGLNIDKSPVLNVQYNVELGKYVLFTSSGSALTIFTSATGDRRTIFNDLTSNDFTIPTNFTLALSTNTVFNGSNINWGNIVDITFGSEYNMYVLDMSANRIVRFDASGFLTNDNVLKNILVYKNSIGGLGSFTDNTKFRNPNSITYYNDNVYVLDAGNSCIKQYDKNLNWLITYRLFSDFLTAGPIQINYDSTGDIYVLNNNWTAYKYNSNFTKKQILNFTALSGLSGSNEQIKRLVFSQTDSNVFYLATSKNFYKKFVNNPNDTIGKYLLSDLNINTNEQFTAFSTLSTTSNGTTYDYNFVFSNNSGIGKIFLFKDYLNITNILTDNVFDVYPLSSITINPDEYLQNWVINKSISKLLMNHIRLRDNISSKFLFQKSNLGDILLAGSRYLLPNELDSIYFNQDVTNFIGLNEIFQNNIVNRPFETIFNIQTNLLSALAPDVRNYYSQPQIVYLN